ncbi:hypothetical protein RCCWILLIS_69 [Rhodobacter phage RcCWillis]|nr:hypothetical protein RCCWILLIS_69 [Rhodobacter phage RcCWillis]
MMDYTKDRDASREIALSDYAEAELTFSEMFGFLSRSMRNRLGRAYRTKPKPVAKSKTDRSKVKAARAQRRAQRG